MKRPVYNFFLNKFYIEFYRSTTDGFSHCCHDADGQTDG